MDELKARIDHLKSVDLALKAIKDNRLNIKDLALVINYYDESIIGSAIESPGYLTVGDRYSLIGMLQSALDSAKLDASFDVEDVGDEEI